MFFHNFAQTTISRLLASAVTGATLFTLIGAGSAGAQVKLRVPGDTLGVPAYARTPAPAGGPFIYHTDEWAAIVFYRLPTCVPRDFNLLKFVDLKDDGTPDPRVFDCPLTVSGFELWESGPPPIGSDAAPRDTNLSGLAVPVWFVPWPVLQTAMADGVLTMPELESLPHLEGLATRFHEILHPIGGPGDPTAGAKVPHLTVTASGVLPDGRSFQYEFTSASSGAAEHVRIVFR